MLRWAARSSRSNGTHSGCLPWRGLEKKLSGCQCPPTCCSTDGDHGCVDGECQGGAVHWVYEHGSVGEGLLRFREGVCAGVRPLKLFGLPTKDLVEWAEDGCDVGDEAAVVVEGAEVPLELLDRGGSRDLVDGVHLLRKRCDSLGADVVTEELERGGAEDAFGTVDHESVGRQLVEDAT